MKIISSIAASLLLSIISNESSAAIWGTDASDSLSGSRSSNGSSIFATESWQNGGFNLSWDISQSNGSWTYNYTLDVTNTLIKVKDVSHFILEVTEGDNAFTAANIFTGTSTPIEGPRYYSASNGNPGLPNPFYGVKFDYGGDVISYSITTDRAPVWGVFYAKDGKDKGNDVLAFANALNFSDFRVNDALTTDDFIVRPDGVTLVPLPAAFWLLGSAILGLLTVKGRQTTMQS